MQQSSEKFIERLRSLCLSGVEREALRSSLLAKMRLPAGMQEASNFRRPILSPWSELFATRRFQAAFLIAVIIVGYGSSAVLAAEGSLPGDVLYPVKTRVVEPLARLVAAQTPATEAAFETKLLERRLHEAEALDDEETLDASLRETVRENVRTQSARAEVAARRADGELSPSALRSATSTIVAATGSPVRFEENQRPERQDERGRSEKRVERAARVLNEHKHILEKLEIQVAEDDAGDDDD